MELASGKLKRGRREPKHVFATPKYFCHPTFVTVATPLQKRDWSGMTPCSRHTDDVAMYHELCSD